VNPNSFVIDPRLLHDISWAEAPNGKPVLTGYPDGGGVPTAGFGHTGKDVAVGQVYTAQQCYDWLYADIETAHNEAAKLPEWSSLNTSARRNAIVECVFNLGERHWTTEFPKTRAAIQQQDWPAASAHLLESPKWIAQVHLPRVQRLADYLLHGAY
jgi:GH24 family phage-related lysozyme (muramidase)